MKTYRTNNPIGSKDPRDLYDNAENLDVFINDKTKTHEKDRFGVERRTWHGIEQKAKLDIAAGVADATAEAGQYRDQAIDAKNAAQTAAMVSGFSKFAENLASLELGIGTEYVDGDVVMVFQDESRNDSSSIYMVESSDAVFKSSFDKTRDDLLSFTGNIVADAEWSDVPAHSDPAFDVQAQALVDRDEYLLENASIKLQNYQALRNYTGKATAVDITSQGIAGRFICRGVVPGVADNGGTSLIDDLGRLWERTFIGPLNVKWFGAIGNYVNDDRSAVLLALAACKPGDFLHFPRGVYRCSDGVEVPVGVYLSGDGSPIMGTFPDRWDDKRFLRTGYKHLIPGSSLVFSGTGTQVGTTVRNAPFNSFRYAVRLNGANSPARLSGIGIIMDMDVLDAAGNLTSPTQDNRSDYDVGLFCDDVTKGEISSNIFGYWKVAGVLHYGSDPDQTVFKDGASSGERGFVVLGTGANGHSATNTRDWNFYASEHHLRDKDHVGTCALLIDGGGYSIGGHHFHGGRINTYCETPIILNSCNNVWFYGPLMETTFLAVQGVTADSIKFISEDGNVSRVGFVGCRWNNTTPVYGADRLSGQIDGPIIFVGGPSGVGNLSGFEMCYQNKVSRLRATSSGFDLNLGGSLNSSTGGITIRNAGDDKIAFLSGGISLATLDATGRMEAMSEYSRLKRHQRASAVITNGAITATRSWMIVTTGTGSGGTLHTINGGTQGDELIISAGLVAEPITIDSVTGNIRSGGVTTVSGANNLRLIYTGTQWQRTSQ